MRNRLTVLTACTILSRAAAAMARTPDFAKATSWLHQNRGLRKAYPALTHVKLGGIHRVQWSRHYFRTLTGRDYFLAPWALKSRQEQIADYKRWRDDCVKRSDLLRGTLGHFTNEVLNRDRRQIWSRGFSGTESRREAGVGNHDVWFDSEYSRWNAGFTAGDVGPNVPDSGPACAVPADRTVGVDAEAALLMEFKEILAEGALVAEEAHVEEGARVAEGAHVEEEVPVAGEALAVQAEKVA